MSSNKEQCVQRALNELVMGLFSSVGNAVGHHGVAKSTAAHRHAGRPSIEATDRKSQRLSREEEKALVQYFRDLQILQLV